MNKEKNNNYLNIEIPVDLKDKIKCIKLTPEFEIIIQFLEDIVIGKIEFKKIDRKSVVDWVKTIEKLMTKLRDKSFDYWLVTKIHILVSRNNEAFKQYIESIKESDEYSKIESSNKNIIKVCKYYSKTDQRNYESVILSGVPYFVSYDEEDLIILETIEEGDRKLVPYGIDNASSKPYEFDSKESLINSIDHVKDIKIDELYVKIKSIVGKYIDQKPHIINIISADTIFSYFQDRFPTTHYLFFAGDNVVGKSVIGDLCEQLCYRGIKITDPSVANIYRLIGKIESAQCTLIIDEADGIENSEEFMKILKTGYANGGKVPRSHPNSYEQEFYNTYCLKIFLAERFPNGQKAKGLHDRLFPITCLIGSPIESLKDVLVTQGKHGNHKLKKLQTEIINLRKTLFLYRLIHAYDERPDIDTGLKNRDKELCECVTLFYGSDVQVEVQESFQQLLNIKYEQKQNSFEARLLFLLLEVLNDCENFGEIFVEDLWNSIKNTLNHIETNDNEIFLVDHNYQLHRNQLSNKCQIFGGMSKHTNQGNKIIFRDIDKLRQIHNNYSNNKPVIKCSVKIPNDEEGEGSEGSEAFGRDTR